MQKYSQHSGPQHSGPQHSGPWVALLAIAFLLFHGACGFDDIDGYEYDSCSGGGGDVNVGGTWVISGRGSRSSCEDDDFDGDFTLESQALNVRQTDVTGSDDELSLSTSIRDFHFSGTVRSSCVDFRTEEDTDRGNFYFDFDGNSSSSGEISGEFTGSGPPGCHSTGTFRVQR